MGTPSDNVRWATREQQYQNRRDQSQTHCKRGHLFTPETSMFKANGTKRCRTCSNALRREAARRGR